MARKCSAKYTDVGWLMPVQVLPFFVKYAAWFFSLALIIIKLISSACLPPLNLKCCRHCNTYKPVALLTISHKSQIKVKSLVSYQRTQVIAFYQGLGWARQMPQINETKQRYRCFWLYYLIPCKVATAIHSRWAAATQTYMRIHTKHEAVDYKQKWQENWLNSQLFERSNIRDLRKNLQ